MTVEGIAKGYSHDPEAIYSPDSGVNHAWNLVLLEGEWRPLDCTWGAGYLHEDGSFRRELNDHWFLTDPEEFLPTHFPYMYRLVLSSQLRSKLSGRQTCRQASRQTDLQTNVQAGRQTDLQAGRQTDRQTDRLTDRQADR